jgi:hypothetical protein
MTKHILEFDLKAVVKQVGHALSATRWNAAPIERDGPRPPGPALWLLGDHGVYLRSNGEPPLMRSKGELPTPIVVYARGINPHNDRDWFERKQEVLPLDGTAVLPWCERIMELHKKHSGASLLRIGIAPDGLSLEGVSMDGATT